MGGEGREIYGSAVHKIREFMKKFSVFGYIVVFTQ